MVHTQTKQCQPHSIFITLRNFTAKKKPWAVTLMKQNENKTQPYVPSSYCAGTEN